MRSFFIAMLSVIFIHHCHAQVGDSDYANLKKRADSLLNRAADSKNAAIVYSQILRLPGAKLNIWDFNRAAFSWSLSGYPDSAFYYLNIISQNKEVTFEDYLRIVDDQAYQSLYKNTRWDYVMDKIFANAQNTFYSIPGNTNAKEKITNQIIATYAWAFNKKNLDSAYYFLNSISSATALEFVDVQNLLTEGYIDPLQSDNRWKQVKEKMFANLMRKYIPKNAFSKTKGKRIIIDEGHNNLHTIKTTYITISGVLNAAGLKVMGFHGRFNKQNLSSTDLLIISNPFGDVIDTIVARARAAQQPFRWSDASSKSAYSNEEAVAIEQWVKSGGSLFLILDHAPNPRAGQFIAEAFGVDIRNVATYDKLYRDPAVDTTAATTIIFTRSKGLIGKHAIMDGVDSVTTATGSSLIGPAHSETLLYLPTTAIDQDWLADTRKYRIRSAAGRTQGVAFKYGKGRVVVLGEASMLNAESTSVKNRGNWQMTLNIIKWLTGNLH